MLTLSRIERKLVPTRNAQKGMALADIFSQLGTWAIIGVVIGIAIFVYFVVLKPRLDANSFATDLQTIIQGLQTYYSAYHKFPKGSGWSWNTNYAYIPADPIQRGWQYSCSSATITITSPTIRNTKVLELVKAKASNICDKVSVSSNKVVCTLYNKPCY
jgi:hypothetical protein